MRPISDGPTKKWYRFISVLFINHEIQKYQKLSIKFKDTRKKHEIVS